jgi:hypothetical protein
MQLELTEQDLAMPVKKLADYYRDQRAKMLAERIDRIYPTNGKYWTLDKMLKSIKAG